MSIIAHTGLDVHEATIRIFASDTDSGEVLLDQTLLNRESTVKKHFLKWSKKYDLRCCYEASSCGYVLQRWLTEIGVSCVVVAPSLVPRRPGDRIKTDRRDAMKLARSYRSGDLTLVRIPTLQEEQDRRVVRYRTSLVQSIVRTKNQIQKHLGGLGVKNPYKSSWTQQHMVWLKELSLEEGDAFVLTELLDLLSFQTTRLKEADRRILELACSETYRERVSKVMCLRGFGIISAMVLVTEIVDFSRFKTARQLMSFLGLVPSESSSGTSRRQGAITKCGNSRCRYILAEAATRYRSAPRLSPALKKRQQEQDERVIAHSWRAQERLHKKYWGIANRKNEKGVAVVAVARELVGFLWAIMNGHLTSAEKTAPAAKKCASQGVKMLQATEIKKALELLQTADPRMVALVGQRLGIPTTTVLADQVG